MRDVWTLCGIFFVSTCCSVVALTLVVRTVASTTLGICRFGVFDHTFARTFGNKDTAAAQYAADTRRPFVVALRVAAAAPVGVFVAAMPTVVTAVTVVAIVHESCPAPIAIARVIAMCAVHVGFFVKVEVNVRTLVQLGAATFGTAWCSNLWYSVVQQPLVQPQPLLARLSLVLARHVACFFLFKVCCLCECCRGARVCCRGVLTWRVDVAC